MVGYIAPKDAVEPENEGEWILLGCNTAKNHEPGCGLEFLVNLANGTEVRAIGRGNRLFKKAEGFKISVHK